MWSKREVFQYVCNKSLTRDYCFHLFSLWFFQKLELFWLINNDNTWRMGTDVGVGGHVILLRRNFFLWKAYHSQLYRERIAKKFVEIRSSFADRASVFPEVSRNYCTKMHCSKAPNVREISRSLAERYISEQNFSIRYQFKIAKAKTKRTINSKQTNQTLQTKLTQQTRKPKHS